MTNPVVTDSTCLIGLELIEHLDILPALFEAILIPPAVQHEFGISLPWLQVEVPTDSGMVVALKMLVARGEAETIALAYQGKLQIIQGRSASAICSPKYGNFFYWNSWGFSQSQTSCTNFCSQAIAG